MSEQEKLPHLNKAEGERLAADLVAPMRARVRGHLGLDVPIDPGAVSPDVSAVKKGDETEAGTGPEAKSEVLKQLESEGAELRKMMDGYDQDVKNRIQTGWITFPESVRMRKTLEESDRLILGSFAKIKNENLSLEQAREELKITRVNLPIVRIYDEYEEGRKFFTAQERGAIEAEYIENTLREAKTTFIDSLPDKKMSREARDYFREKILTKLEEEILEYMDAIVIEKDEKRKKRLNRGALREILLIIVDAEINSM